MWKSANVVEKVEPANCRSISISIGIYHLKINGDMHKPTSDHRSSCKNLFYVRYLPLKFFIIVGIGGCNGHIHSIRSYLPWFPTPHFNLWRTVSCTDYGCVRNIFSIRLSNGENNLFSRNDENKSLFFVKPQQGFLVSHFLEQFSAKSE